MRRLICLILMLLLLTPAVYAEGEQLTFYMEDVSGDVGDTVTVVGAVKNAPECASFQIIFTYDPAVLEPVSCTKQEVKGMFMQNINYTYKGQPAVNVLSAAAQRVLSGDMKLFTVEFKILAETAGDHGTALKVVKQDFFDPTPTRVIPIVEPCTIYVGDDTPAPSLDGEGEATNPGEGEATNPGEGEATNPGGETTTPGGEPTTPGEEPTTPGGEPTTPGGEPTTPGGETTTPGNGENDGSTQTGNTRPSQGDGYNNEGAGNSDGNVEEPKDDTPASTVPEEPQKEDPKAPTGSWVVDESNDDLYHLDEDGTTTVYVPEYVETPEPGKVTEVILKDKDTGEEAGSIKVEGKEDGSFDVVEQDLIKDRVEKPGFPVWGWALVGFAVAAAAIAGVWFFLSPRKRNTAS